jgi:hypothetical protein
VTSDELEAQICGGARAVSTSCDAVLSSSIKCLMTNDNEIPDDQDLERTTGFEPATLTLAR